MTAQELIKELQKYKPETVVYLTHLTLLGDTRVKGVSLEVDYRLGNSDGVLIIECGLE